VTSGSEPGEAPQHTVLSVLRGAETWLERRGIDAPKRSAELLLGKVLGLTRLQLYLAHDRPLAPAERSAMRELLVRRGDAVPVAHLLGSWSFRGLELVVGPAVLVPRPETEELVDLVLERAPHGGAVIDLGTGSGAIAIAVAEARSDLQVVAVDCSEAALAVATANVQRHGLEARVELRCGSWWEPVPSEATFDVVVSNPPYIDPNDPAGLADDVRRFEPGLALFSAPGDVLSCYRAIAAPLAQRLRPGGWIVCETGLGAAQPGLDWLATLEFLQGAQLLPDLAGAPRFLVAQRAGEP